MNKQYWLAELDRYGNPKLIDGAHSDAAGVNRAAYLRGRIWPDDKLRFAVAEVRLTPIEPRSEGVDEEAAEACRQMVERARERK